MSRPTLLLDFTLKIFQVIIYFSCESSSIDSASLALYYLAACDERIFTSACEQIIANASVVKQQQQFMRESGSSQALVLALRSQFQVLFNGIRIQGGDRTDRKKFTSNLNSFVAHVRGFVLLK